MKGKDDDHTTHFFLFSPEVSEGKRDREAEVV